MKCKLIIDQLEAKKLYNVNIIEYKEPLQIIRELAKCYREVNPKTSENERIKARKAWGSYDPEGGHVQHFRFTCKGVAPGIDYIYTYEFSGCGLD